MELKYSKWIVQYFHRLRYVNDTMFIETGNSFAAGSYYWTFGYGVGCGPEYCRPETYPVISILHFGHSLGLDHQQQYCQHKHFHLEVQ